MDNYDIAVIGGGPAGYVAAIKGAQLGGHVVLFEKDTVGGTCLNRGCIPTKTFLKGAEIIHTIQMAGNYGIENDSSFSVDMGKAVENKNHIVKQLTSGVAALLWIYVMVKQFWLMSIRSNAGTSCIRRKIFYCAEVQRRIKFRFQGLRTRMFLQVMKFWILQSCRKG